MSSCFAGFFPCFSLALQSSCYCFSLRAPSVLRSCSSTPTLCKALQERLQQSSCSKRDCFSSASSACAKSRKKLPSSLLFFFSLVTLCSRKISRYSSAAYSFRQQQLRSRSRRRSEKEEKQRGGEEERIRGCLSTLPWPLAPTCFAALQGRGLHSKRGY